MTQAIHIGDLISNRYEIVRIIDEKNETCILECIDTRLDVPCVLKMVLEDTDADVTQARKQNFMKSAIIQAKLNHPNIVHVNNVESTENATFLVMDLLHGETLAEYVARRILSPHEILEIMIPAADAIAIGHESGIAHKCLSPYNIVLNQQGARFSPKILNFASFCVPNQRDPLKSIPYFAPEQLLDNEHADFRADVYSLAMVLCFCFTGTVPYRAPRCEDYVKYYSEIRTITQYPPEIPNILRPFLSRALSTQASNRFANASEVVSFLQSIKATAPKTAYPRRTCAPGFSGASQPVISNLLPNTLSGVCKAVKLLEETKISKSCLVSYQDASGVQRGVVKFLTNSTPERNVVFNQGVALQQRLEAYSQNIEHVCAHFPAQAAFITSNEPKESLYDLVQRKGVLDPGFVLRAFIRLGEALHVCHAYNGIHGGIKPENILFVTRNNESIPVLTDFGQKVGLGIEEYLEECSLDEIAYLAPEFLQDGIHNPQQDIFAFGMCMNYAFWGKSFYVAESVESLLSSIQTQESIVSLGQLCPELNLDLIHVVDWCTAYDPSKRYAQFSDVVRDLHAVLRLLAEE